MVYFCAPAIWDMDFGGWGLFGFWGVEFEELYEGLVRALDVEGQDVAVAATSVVSFWMSIVSVSSYSTTSPSSSSEKRGPS